MTTSTMVPRNSAPSFLGSNVMTVTSCVQARCVDTGSFPAAPGAGAYGTNYQLNGPITPVGADRGSSLNGGHRLLVGFAQAGGHGGQQLAREGGHGVEHAVELALAEHQQRH